MAETPDTTGLPASSDDAGYSGPLSGTVPAWSLRHPYTVIAFYLAVVLLSVGAIAYLLPTRMMPYVESPLIGIITGYPGFSAEEIETYISKPIEERMTDVKGVHFIRSTSQEDFSVVTVEFYYGWDMQRALVEIQQLMTTVQADLPYDPANLKPSWVLPIDPLNLPVLVLAMEGEGWDDIALRTFADNQLVNRLKQRVPNLWGVMTSGGLKRQLRIQVDRDKLAAYGLSITDARDAVDANNVDRSGGRLTAQEHEYIVRFPARATNAEMVADYPVGAYKGRIVYLRDVAKVSDDHRERRSAYHFNGKGAVGVSIIETPWASSPRVIRDTMAELKKIEQENPGLKFTPAYDNSHFVSILLKNMREELIVAVILTGIVILFFLGEWRSTLISLTTIPTTLGMTMLILWVFGFTLNSTTLIGLLLSIGRLVDDSIVDLHSVQRHLAMGKSPPRAAVEGIMEVRLAVMAATFIIVIALVPLAFSGGIVQLMFSGIVWPIIVALLVSMIVSFTLTPLMAAHIMKPAAHGKSRLDRLLAHSVRLLERLESGYRRALSWSLNNRGLVIAIAVTTIILGLAIYPFLGSEMMPIADVSQAFGTMEAQPGTSLAKTEAMTYQLEQLLLRQPEVTRVSTDIGFEGMGLYYTGYSAGLVNTANLMITLQDKEERKSGRSIWQVIDAVQQEATHTIPGIRRLQIKEMGADVMATSAAPVQVIIYGKDLDTLYQLGEASRKIAADIPGLYQVSTSWAMTQPYYEVEVDRRRAQDIGMSVGSVAEQAYYALGGGLPREFYYLDNLRKFTMNIRYDQPNRTYPANIDQLYITTPMGQQVPLTSIADVRYRPGPSLIEHDGPDRRVISILGYYRRGGPGSMALSMAVMMRSLMGLNFPPGYGMEMRGDMTQMMDSFNRIIRMLGLAVIFILLTLIAQFRGFAQPLNMVLSLPLELSGIFFALFLAHQTFSTVSILAIVILTGMDITVAILLIDLVLRLRAEGQPRRDAILEGASVRLRPILMTSLITIVVLIPVAFFPKTGIDAYSPLATVVIGGLSVGTVLSLFVIPCLYTYVDDFGTWVNRRLGRRTA